MDNVDVNFEQKVSIDAEDSQEPLWYCFVYYQQVLFLLKNNIEAVNLSKHWLYNKA